MIILKNEELLEIVGGDGGLSLGFGLIFGGIVVIVAGIIDGYLRPLKCVE